MDEQQDTVNSDSTTQNGTGVQDSYLEEQKWTDKGNAAAREENYEAAAEAFQHAVDANPNDARARYNLALAQQLLRDTEIAIAGYRRAIDLDPQLIDAYINLGNLSSELGMHEEALETYQQALEFDPDNDELYLNVGDAYRTQNLYEDAIQAYRQALILNPDNASAAGNLREIRELVNEQIDRHLSNGNGNPPGAGCNLCVRFG